MGERGKLQRGKDVAPRGRIEGLARNLLVILDNIEAFVIIIYDRPS